VKFTTVKDVIEIEDCPYIPLYKFNLNYLPLEEIEDNFIVIGRKRCGLFLQDVSPRAIPELTTLHTYNKTFFLRMILNLSLSESRKISKYVGKRVSKMTWAELKKNVIPRDLVRLVNVNLVSENETYSANVVEYIDGENSTNLLSVLKEVPKSTKVFLKPYSYEFFSTKGAITSFSQFQKYVHSIQGEIK